MVEYRETGASMFVHFQTLFNACLSNGRQKEIAMSQIVNGRLASWCLMFGLAAAQPALAVTQYIGSALIPGTGIDASGLPAILENGVNANNTLNGFGSAIAYTGFQNRYVLLPDRGPNATAYAGGAAVDNTVSWVNRYQIYDLTFTPTGGGNYNVGFQFADTTLLSNGAGQNYIGKSNAFVAGSPNDPVNNLRMDPEGIRVGFNGEVYISDEYGPVVHRFDQSGQRTGSFNVPDYYTIANPNSLAATENSNVIVPFNTDPRRITNRGMESLAISPDGSTLFGMMQNSLQQDGGTGGNRVRILQWDTANPSAAPQEYVYLLEPGNRVVSEFVAINDHEFLVVERDQLAGVNAAFKRVFKIDLTGATDIAGVADLDLVAAPTPVQKSLFFDLLTGTGIEPTSFTALKDLLSDTVDLDLFPEKIEGITFGPTLPDGRLLLLISNDNDFLGVNPNYVFAFAIDAGDLNFVAQTFADGLVFGPIPEPATTSLGLMGLAMLFLRRRREV